MRLGAKVGIPSYRRHQPQGRASRSFGRVSAMQACVRLESGPPHGGAPAFGKPGAVFAWAEPAHQKVSTTSVEIQREREDNGGHRSRVSGI